jgi:hypothetical protein
VRRVWVRREDLAAGELPAVCAVSGQPTDLQVRTRFETLPDWTWILLLFGVLPFLVALVFATERIPALVPLHQDVLDRRRAHRRRGWLAGVAGAALLVLGMVADAAVPVWLGLAALGVVLLSLLGASRAFPRARPDRSGLGVWLRGVHPSFVAAVEQTAAVRP